MSTNLFEIATRNAYRFSSVKGLLSVEDLWTLPLSGKSANLDDIAKELFKQLKVDNISFVAPVEANAAQDELTNKFEIVKHIIAVKVSVRDAVVAETVKRQQRDKILQVITEKQDESLKNLSVEELTAMVNNLK